MSTTAAAQTLNDGPIQLRIRVAEVETNFTETDSSFFGAAVGFPDEMTYRLWAREAGDAFGTGWQGAPASCLQHNFPSGTLPGASASFGTVFFDVTYPTSTVPARFDLRLDAWEDERDDQLLGIGCGGTRCVHDIGFCCGGFLFGLCLGAIDDDDLRCNANPFALDLDYRLGGACEWYDHGRITGNCPANNVYRPRIESYWRYTNGSASTPIELGTLTGVRSHANSNACYANNAPSAAGNDVRYRFTVAQPLQLHASLCGAGFDTVLTLLDGSNTVIDSNDNSCGSASQLTAALLPGTYFVVVDGATAAAMGPFTLTLTPTFDPELNTLAFPFASIPEGTNVSIEGTFIPDPAGLTSHSVVVVWGDGANNSAMVLSPGVGALAVGHTFIDDPPGPADDYTASVTVSNGILSGTRTATIVVTNVPPAPNAGLAQAVNEGDTVALLGSFTDPGADSHTILWQTSAPASQAVADGAALGYGFTAEHVGAYTSTLTVTDDDGGSGSASVQIVAANLTPSITLGVNAAVGQAPTGGTVTVNLVVSNTSGATDPVTLDALSDDVLGSLSGVGTCSLPQVVAPGANYTCSYPRPIGGTPGTDVTVGVSAGAQDDENSPATSAGEISIGIQAIIDVPTLPGFGLAALAVLLLFAGLMAQRRLRTR